ncbi:MAG: hypothetical protein AVDCRST_MAG17-480, partial [uncultured Solirubrobacterales bacterium]
ELGRSPRRAERARRLDGPGNSAGHTTSAFAGRRLRRLDRRRARSRRCALLPGLASNAVGRLRARAGRWSRARARGPAVRSANRLRGQPCRHDPDGRLSRARAAERPAHPGSHRSGNGCARAPRRGRSRPVLRVPHRAPASQHPRDGLLRLRPARRPRRLRRHLRRDARGAGGPTAGCRGRARLHGAQPRGLGGHCQRRPGRPLPPRHATLAAAHGRRVRVGERARGPRRARALRSSGRGDRGNRRLWTPGREHRDAVALGRWRLARRGVGVVTPGPPSRPRGCRPGPAARRRIARLFAPRWARARGRAAPWGTGAADRARGDLVARGRPIRRHSRGGAALARSATGGTGGARGRRGPRRARNRGAAGPVRTRADQGDGIGASPPAGHGRCRPRLGRGGVRAISGKRRSAALSTEAGTGRRGARGRRRRAGARTAARL